MIDANQEDLLSLTQAARLLPARRGGKQPHVSCLYRWTTAGCKGVVLESLQIGGTRCTSKEALARFFGRLTQEASPEAETTRSVARRRRAAEAAERQLEREGIRAMEAINLKRRFYRRYRVTYEESYWAEYGPGARVEDPWLMILLCRYGHIYPHGGQMLAVSVDGHPNVAGRLRRLSCCRVHQDGDFEELAVIFDVADFAQVAEIMRPRRRRQVSPAERERLRAIGFKGAQTHVDVQHTPPERIFAGQRDQMPT